jgi:hypothetical protein
MIFGKLLQKVRGWCGWVSEEKALNEEVMKLDTENPGWNRVARVTRARTALEIGIRRESVVWIYGEEIMREAEGK